MSNEKEKKIKKEKHYVPIPVFDTLVEVTYQYKKISSSTDPQSIIKD